MFAVQQNFHSDLSKLTINANMREDSSLWLICTVTGTQNKSKKTEKVTARTLRGVLQGYEHIFRLGTVILPQNKSHLGVKAPITEAVLQLFFSEAAPGL